MKLRRLFLSLLLIGFISVMAPHVMAHLESGSDTRVGNFIVDFGFAPNPLIAGNRATIAFNLLDRKTNPVDIDAVWIRISSSQDVLFSGSFKPHGSNITFSYTFPSKGAYEITSRFQKNGKSVVESSNRITVIDPPGTIPHRTFVFSLTALVCGVLAGLIIARARS